MKNLRQSDVRNSAQRDTDLQLYVELSQSSCVVCGVTQDPSYLILYIYISKHFQRHHLLTHSYNNALCHLGIGGWVTGGVRMCEKLAFASMVASAVREQQ